MNSSEHFYSHIRWAEFEVHCYHGYWSIGCLFGLIQLYFIQYCSSWLINFQIEYNVFVANRIAKVKKLLPDCMWNYILTIQNSADCVSSGLLAPQLWGHNLYWKWPDLLRKWDSQTIFEKFHPLPILEIPELKESFSARVSSKLYERLSQYSSLSFTERVVALIWRYMCRLRKQPYLQVHWKGLNFKRHYIY